MWQAQAGLDLVNVLGAVSLVGLTYNTLAYVYAPPFVDTKKYGWNIVYCSLGYCVSCVGYRYCKAKLA
jgi:hypothetical protein